MRLLGDVKDEGGKYITAGKHEVRIADVKDSTSNKGNACKDYYFEDSEGRGISTRLSLSDAALWKVKTLVAAAGVPPDKLDMFDVDNDKHHQALIGRKLIIEVVKGEKYHDVEKWYSLAGKTQQAEQKQQGASIVDRLTAAANATEDDVPF